MCLSIIRFGYVLYADKVLQFQTTEFRSSINILNHSKFECDIFWCVREALILSPIRVLNDRKLNSLIASHNGIANAITNKHSNHNVFNDSVFVVCVCVPFDFVNE